MIEPKIENLMELAREIALQRQERFDCENHVGLAMDQIIPGAAYLPTDTIHEKINKLVYRGLLYIKYDRLLVKNAVNKDFRQIAAAIQRLTVLDAHLKDFDGTSEKDGKLGFLSLLCKVNGMFLGREVLNYKFTFFTHSQLFDHFVQKDPYKLEVSGETSIAQQDDWKERLILLPRGAYKSTGDVSDCINWIINAPNVRILLLASGKRLAELFVEEIKKHFIVDFDNLEDFTPFQYIFAADVRYERPKVNGEFQKFCFLAEPDKKGKLNFFVCPCKDQAGPHKKEETLFAASVGTSVAGFHADLLICDDAVDSKNAETPQLIEKTNQSIEMAQKTVDPGGCFTYIGTPYSSADFYASLMSSDNVLKLMKPAKWLKKDLDGATAFDRAKSFDGLRDIRTEKDLVDGDWTLLFPFDKYGKEALSYDILRRNFRMGPKTFASQYMLDSGGRKNISFTQDLIQTRTLTPEQFPDTAGMQHYITWDLADTATAVSDYSVGSVFAVNREGVAYVPEILRDRYTTFSQLCYAIASLSHKYKPVRVIIENARGAEKLRGDITRSAQDMGDRNIPLDFVKVANVKSAKAIRIGKLEPRLRDGRLFFSSSIECYEELVEEFVNFGAWPHDDIPDSLGLSENFLEDMRSAPIDPVAAAAAQRILASKELFELIHNGPYVDVPLDPIENTEIAGTGTNEAGDLWDPYAIGRGGFKR